MYAQIIDVFTYGSSSSKLRAADALPYAFRFVNKIPKNPSSGVWYAVPVLPLALL